MQETGKDKGSGAESDGSEQTAQKGPEGETQEGGGADLTSGQDKESGAGT
ncbi:MAG: hypothetical protein SCABRO_01975, partial [Candidatus Scalindua brodae]